MYCTQLTTGQKHEADLWPASVLRLCQLRSKWDCVVRVFSNVCEAQMNHSRVSFLPLFCFMGQASGPLICRALSSSSGSWLECQEGKVTRASLSYDDVRFLQMMNGKLDCWENSLIFIQYWCFGSITAPYFSLSSPLIPFIFDPVLVWLAQTSMNFCLSLAEKVENGPDRRMRLQFACVAPAP